jgi:hypothetical protein
MNKEEPGSSPTSHRPVRLPETRGGGAVEKRETPTTESIWEREREERNESLAVRSNYVLLEISILTMQSYEIVSNKTPHVVDYTKYPSVLHALSFVKSTDVLSVSFTYLNQPQLSI